MILWKGLSTKAHFYVFFYSPVDLNGYGSFFSSALLRVLTLACFVIFSHSPFRLYFSKVAIAITTHFVGLDEILPFEKIRMMKSTLCIGFIVMKMLNSHTFLRENNLQDS